MKLEIVVPILSAIAFCSPLVCALADHQSQIFRIVEESPNGTEIEGVSEYLHSVIASEAHASFQLLDSHEMFPRLLKIEAQAGRLFIDSRIDREVLCPPSSREPTKYPDVEDSCTKQINILAAVQQDNKPEVFVQTIPLKFVIQDVNDNAPTWNTAGKQLNGLPLLEASILEQQGPTTNIQFPAAYDPDLGANGDISYRLENYRNPTDDNVDASALDPAPFKISGPVNGMLQLTPYESIDYEKQSVYNLLLVASDAGRPPKMGTARLRVNVIDVNDEAPVFAQHIFMPPGGQGISERTHPGKVILNVTAVDGDASERNSRLTYSMVSSNNRLISETFSVHSDGRVLLRHWLDYETLESSYMASSAAAAREAPAFKGKQFAFFVKATDSAPPPYEKTGTALVVIPVIDENDERPIITSRFLGPPDLVKHEEAGAIMENSTVPISLAYIQARDPDFDGRDRIECNVPDNGNLSLVRISSLPRRQSNFEVNKELNNNDFLLSLEVPIDRETTQMLQVRIHCVDEANNTADKLINIRILDINDEAPSFLWPIFYFSVNENTKVPTTAGNSNETSQGYRIGRVVAYDKDQGDNAKISYSLQPSIEIEEPQMLTNDYDPVISATEAADLFRIDSLTGELFALRSFDAEKERLIKFQVTVADQPSDPTAVSHTGTASVYVQITDLNDWSPVFYQVLTEDDKQTYHSGLLDETASVDSYQFSIKENSPAYTRVGRIAAIDPDVSFWSAYGAVQTNETSSESSRSLRGVALQFAPGTTVNVENSFSIHSISGILRTTRPLDREACANYTFNVIAIDKGPADGISRTSTAIVTILVEDENDNDPVFVRPTQGSEVNKVSGEGTSYIEGNAVQSPSQSLDSSSSSPSDIDLIPVVAVSRPAGGGSNDGSSNPTARPLIRIEAQDPDAGHNGLILYTISAGNTDDLFFLDPVSGSLLLKSTHPSANGAATYVLQLEACDQGIPSRCASPARLRIVMDGPAAGKLRSLGGSNYPLSRDSNIYHHSGRYASGPPEADGESDIDYPAPWGNGMYGETAPRWTSSRSKWDDNGHRYLREDYERSGVQFRRNGVSVSEAVIICVAVIFAVFLCAALVLIYLVRRKSLYFAIGGKQRRKAAETSTDINYCPGNYKNEISTNCQNLEPKDSTSLYRMVPGTQPPGKIVFVDNNFDRQSVAGGPTLDAPSLSPNTNSKCLADPMLDYSLRRGMSASAAVLTNLETVYITCPGTQGASMETSEYPEAVTRSAFNYPHKMSRDGLPANTLPHTLFGTLVGPNGTTQAVNLGPQGEYDSVMFQRRCTSLKPHSGVKPTQHTYRYIHPPYVYTPIVGSPPGRVVHCGGFFDQNNSNTLSPYSPHNSTHHRQPYVYAGDPHTYHDLDLLTTTLQRQRRPIEQFVEMTPPMVPSPAKGRIRQPMNAYAIAAQNNRYATLKARMAPDGEVTSLMETMATMKRARIPVSTTVVELDPSGMGSSAGQSECLPNAFDHRSSQNSLSDAFGDAEFEGDDVGLDMDQDSITDPNAQLLTSDERVRTLTLRKPLSCPQGDQTSPPHHQTESESQATEEIIINSENGFPSSTLDNLQLPPPTYAVHEASFV